MKCERTFFSAIVAGMWIAIGGTVYLSVENQFIGALLFTVGLFTICIFGLNLYTGMVCDVLHNGKYYAIHVAYAWFGNLVGTSAVAMLQKMTRIGTKLQEKAVVICQTKLNDSLISIFILAVFCNMLIYLAVKGFRSNGGYIAMFFGVVVFILCGFEHCVANMYYFSIAEMWNRTSLLYLMLMTFGNAVGGMLMSTLIDQKEGDQ